MMKKNNLIKIIFVSLTVALVTVNVKATDLIEEISLNDIWRVECNYGPGGELTSASCKTGGTYDCECPGSVIQE